MACPRASGDVDLNTKNRDKTIEKHNYGPLNLSDDGYWELIADKWNTTEAVAKKSKCGNCVAFDVSPRMDECMPGPVSDGEGRLGYCWMHHFKCHSARTCNTWAKGGPIKKDEDSHDWQKKAKGIEKKAQIDDPRLVQQELYGRKGPKNYSEFSDNDLKAIQGKHKADVNMLYPATATVLGAGGAGLGALGVGLGTRSLGGAATGALGVGTAGALAGLYSAHQIRKMTEEGDRHKMLLAELKQRGINPSSIRAKDIKKEASKPQKKKEGPGLGTAAAFTAVPAAVGFGGQVAATRATAPYTEAGDITNVTMGDLPFLDSDEGFADGGKLQKRLEKHEKTVRKNALMMADMKGLTGIARAMFIREYQSDNASMLREVKDSYDKRKAQGVQDLDVSGYSDVIQDKVRKLREQGIKIQDDIPTEITDSIQNTYKQIEELREQGKGGAALDLQEKLTKFIEKAQGQIRGFGGAVATPNAIGMMPGSHEALLAHEIGHVEKGKIGKIINTVGGVGQFISKLPGMGAATGLTAGLGAVRAGKKGTEEEKDKAYRQAQVATGVMGAPAGLSALEEGRANFNALQTGRKAGKLKEYAKVLAPAYSTYLAKASVPAMALGGLEYFRRKNKKKSQTPMLKAPMTKKAEDYRHHIDPKEINAYKNRAHLAGLLASAPGAFMDVGGHSIGFGADMAIDAVKRGIVDDLGRGKSKHKKKALEKMKFVDNVATLTGMGSAVANSVYSGITGKRNSVANYMRTVLPEIAAREYGMHRLKKKSKMKKTASSRVKSPHSFYQAAPPPQPVPLEAMNQGNSVNMSQQAVSVAQAAKQKSLESQAKIPPPPPPSIQNNTPMVQKPFTPRYTGM